MKILLVNNTFGNFGGGAEKVSYETGKILREKGFNVYFFSSDKKPYFEEDYLYKIFFPQEINKCRLCELIKIFYNFEAEKKLSRLLKIIKPDVVHINSIAHNLTVSALVACEKNNVPVVMTFHDSQIACPAATLLKGNGSYCTDMDCIEGNILPCLTNKCYSNNYGKSLIAGLDFLFKKKGNYYNIPNVIICPSNFIRDIAVKSGLNKEKLNVVKNFASPEYLAKTPEYSSQDYFLYVGRLVKEKGIEYLLEAFSYMPDMKLKIAGDGPYRRTLENISSGMNLSNVEFLGLKSSAELEFLYRNTIATMLPSVCSENAPLTVLESFAFGKPVIASRIGGIPEIVENNFNGLLVSPANAQEIKQAVQTLYDDNELAVLMGQNARKTLDEKYNTDVYFEKLLEVYNSVINKCINNEINEYFPQKMSLELESTVR